jgi:hypothetical protein
MTTVPTERPEPTIVESERGLLVTVLLVVLLGTVAVMLMVG